MRLKSKILLTSIAVSAFLVGCGSSDATSSSSSSVSGVVSGSFYQNAKVCFDSTGDGTCADESSYTLSDANGSFTLTGTEANIVAELNSSTKHEVIGDTGTLISTNQKFRMPKGLKDTNGEYIVSAISSKVYDKMQEDTTLSATQAKEAVALLLGVDKDKLMENFNSQEIDSSVRAKLQDESTRILSVMSPDGDLNTTSARAYVSSMTLPSKVDAIKAE